MRAVLDASVAIAWVLPYPLAPQATRLRDEYSGHLHELIAPRCFPEEIASALTKAERQKIIETGEARWLIAQVFRTPPILLAHAHLLYRAMDISSHTRSGFYDCLYIARAEREGCDVLTADQKLVRNVQKQYPFVRSIAAY